MGNLIAIAYPNKETAEQAGSTLAGLQKQKLIQLEDMVVVAKKGNGKLEVDQAFSTTAAGAAGGAIWGGLIGLLFLAPLLGMAIGAASGAISGKLSDYGVDDSLVKDLGTNLQPGQAALIVLVHQVTPDKVLAEMRKFGGTVLQSSLTNEQEAQLQAALSGAGA